MRFRRFHVIALAAITLLTGVVAAGPASAATTRKIEGRVLSVDRGERSFRLRDSERGTFTVFVTGSTRFERVTFSALSAGRGLEATIRRSNSRWVAVKVQPRSATGSHTAGGADDNGGSRNRRGSDDGPNHT
jgi:hypothetical protein